MTPGIYCSTPTIDGHPISSRPGDTVGMACAAEQWRRAREEQGQDVREAMGHIVAVDTRNFAESMCIWFEPTQEALDGCVLDRRFMASDGAPDVYNPREVVDGG